MNILYASDDNYAEIMGTSIVSLLENNKDEDEITIYIVQDDISKENKKKLVELVESYNRKIVIIDKPDIRRMLSVELKTLRWSDSAFSRLFLKKIFGNNPSIERILYLDCDVLVIGSLEELYSTNIDDYLGAACLECMGNLHKKIIGRNPKNNYLNSGVLLLNVKRWIEEDVDSLEGEFIKKCDGKIEYVDQGVINGTISDRFKLVSPRFNLTTMAYDMTYEEMQIYRKPSFGYSKNEWEDALANPVIIHFTTSFLSIRPWYKGSKHPYADEWMEYHQKSPWYSLGYRKYKDEKKHQNKVKLFNFFSRTIGIRIAGVLHCYIKPIIYLMLG